MAVQDRKVHLQSPASAFAAPGNEVEFIRMRVVDRYIVRTVLAAVLLVTAVLLVLVGLFMFISEQGQVGTGGYTNVLALRFVALNLPSQLFEFLPVGALIGGLMGLGALARTSELTVMRAAGISKQRIGGAVAMAGLMLVLLAAVVGEWLAPALGQIAREQKAFSRFANVSFAGQGGAWIRDGDLFVKAEQRATNGAFAGFTVFDISPDNQLLGVGRAASAVERPGDGWTLQDYAESRFAGDSVTSSSEPARALSTRASAEFLGVAATDPMDLSVRALQSVIGYLKANGQETREYRFAMWSRVARTCAIFFGVLLALPFVFGSLRASGAGARMVLGLALGISWFMLQKMIENGTQAFGLDPVLLAWTPTLVLALAVGVMVVRLR
jgi:lipopolysaccharide export system permease protein